MPIVDTNWNPNKKELRQFALLQILFFAVVAWTMSRRGFAESTVVTVVGISVALGLVGVLYTPIIRVVYVVWMAAVFPIGFVMSYVLMGAVYYLVITPIGLMMRMCGRNPMHPKFDRNAATYWIERSNASDAARYFRQY